MSIKDDLAAVVAQLGKSKGEILTKLDSLSANIASLQEQINAGTRAAQDLADAASTLDELRVTAQALDDIVPDEPTP